MKNKKLKLALCLFCVIIATVNISCIGSMRAESVAKELSKSSNFEFGLLEEVTDKNLFEGYTVIPGFGITGYVHPKYGEDYDSEGNVYIWYSVAGWPDTLSNKQCVVGIQGNDPEYYFYGVRVGDGYSKWKTALEERGFKISNSNNVFENGKIRISLGVNVDCVISFSIYAFTTNLSGVVY